MKEIWVELLYFDGVGLQNIYGTVEGSIEEAVLNKREDEWVRLDKVRDLNEEATEVRKFEDDLAGTASYLYLRSRCIFRVSPIRPEVSFWAEGKAPLTGLASEEEH